MAKRLEVWVRMVDGAQLCWDARVEVADLTPEEVEAVMPRQATSTTSWEDRHRIQGQVGEKFKAAAVNLWERAKQRTS